MMAGTMQQWIWIDMFHANLRSFCICNYRQLSPEKNRRFGAEIRFDVPMTIGRRDPVNNEKISSIE